MEETADVEILLLLHERIVYSTDSVIRELLFNNKITINYLFDSKFWKCSESLIKPDNVYSKIWWDFINNNNLSASERVAGSIK
jgi:hypothetical protein